MLVPVLQCHGQLGNVRLLWVQGGVLPERCVLCRSVREGRSRWHRSGRGGRHGERCGWTVDAQDKTISLVVVVEYSRVGDFRKLDNNKRKRGVQSCPVLFGEARLRFVGNWRQIFGWVAGKGAEEWTWNLGSKYPIAARDTLAVSSLEYQWGRSCDPEQGFSVAEME